MSHPRIGIPPSNSSSSVSICTFVLIKQVYKDTQGFLLFLEKASSLSNLIASFCFHLVYYCSNTSQMRVRGGIVFRRLTKTTDETETQFRGKRVLSLLFLARSLSLSLSLSLPLGVHRHCSVCVARVAVLSQIVNTTRLPPQTRKDRQKRVFICGYAVLIMHP